MLDEGLCNLMIICMTIVVHVMEHLMVHLVMVPYQ